MLRNRLILLLFIVGSGILVGHVGGSVSYLLFYCSLILPLLAIFYVVFVYLKFCIYQEIDSKILVKEELVPYLFKLSNEDMLSYIKIKVTFMKDYSDVDRMNQETDYSLLPGEEITCSTKLCCHYRGEYKVGIDYVTVSDFLNLFRITYPCKSAIEVKVFPRVLHIERLVIAPRCEDIKSQPFMIQSQQVIPDVEVRNYQTSDSKKMIHWKATAKQHEILVRKYTEEPKSELVVLLDLQMNKSQLKERIIVEDKLIEATLALADYFVRNNTPIVILYDFNGIHRMPVYNKSDFDQLYQFCSEVRFHSDKAVEWLLNLAIQQSTGQKLYCMLLTASITNELCKKIYDFTSFGHELSMILAGDNHPQDVIDNVVDHIRLYQINNSQEVKDVLEMEAV